MEVVATTDRWKDPSSASGYVQGVKAAVPYLPAVHGLVDQLLSETVPDDGRVLVVGAGGGLELNHLAERHDGWTFEGVDPSAPMLQLARETLGPLAARATLVEGYVDDASAGPFDGATGMLVLHFLPEEQRLDALREIHRRLRPGAPLLTFHHSPPGDAARTWFTRFSRVAADPDDDEAQIAARADALVTKLPVLSPEQDEALLRAAGFRDVGLFFAALTFRGWIAYR